MQGLRVGSSGGVSAPGPSSPPRGSNVIGGENGTNGKTARGSDESVRIKSAAVPSSSGDPSSATRIPDNDGPSRHVGVGEEDFRRPLMPTSSPSNESDRLRREELRRQQEETRLLHEAQKRQEEERRREREKEDRLARLREEEDRKEREEEERIGRMKEAENLKLKFAKDGGGEVVLKGHVTVQGGESIVRVVPFPRLFSDLRLSGSLTSDEFVTVLETEMVRVDG